ncbi:regulatory protein RecX [Lactococcus hodotermopsidis]|uniref:Regulatory protein RecX n=1 Tax=Pseudolactococcus hodotermopsidis TaxID=2709157 RepID=A0A6A0B7W0_9LACT|nr:recombination regulator RecX [Lactococcus hodotermopsidis]GFH41499.1 regulatory protein RecX [Lactococcus hodotermopsidis]
MAKIISLEKKKRLYKVVFDDGRTIYVTEDTIVRFFLSKGAYFDDSQIVAITEFADFSRGKNLGLYYLSFKQRTKKEVCRYLSEHEIPNAQISQIIADLTKMGYINDQNYTESFVRGKISSKSTGPYNIQQKLSEKGVDKALIISVLAEFYDHDAQVEVASHIAEKLVMSKYSRLPLKALKMKITTSLTSKGFSYDISKIAIERLELDADLDNESELFQKELDKIMRKYSRKYDGYDLKQRVTNALARKGFDFDVINRELREIDF